MYDERVARAEINVLPPVLELVRADHLLDIRIALERLGSGLKHHIHPDLLFRLVHELGWLFREVEGNKLERRVRGKVDRHALVQLVHVVDDVLHLRARIVEVRGFDSTEDVD